MRSIKKIMLLFLCGQILFSCCDKSIAIYHGSHINKGDNILIDIDDGVYIFKKEFKEAISNDGQIKIDDYCIKEKKSLKIYFKYNEIDTTFFVSKIPERILLYSKSNNQLYLYTEKNEDAWVEY